MSEIVHRIGLLVPSSDGVAELDFKNLLPRNVSFHTGRLYHHDSTPRGFATLDEIVGHADEAIRTILQVDPELIVFACTSGSFYRGIGWDKEIAERITRASGVPSIVTTTAVIDALRALEIETLYMLSPYPEDINKIEIQFFRDSGVAITGHTYFQCARSKEVANILPTTIIERVLSVRDEVEGCDGLLISCTGLRGADTIVHLERELGIPVVTSNAATVWATLRELGQSRSSIPGGRLFALAESRRPVVA